jgi:hypothetical protein
LIVVKNALNGFAVSTSNLSQSMGFVVLEVTFNERVLAYLHLLVAAQFSDASFEDIQI